MPKVSVIIPAYNAMNFLPITLESVFNQSFTDYEVIIVNDGSADGIEEWADNIHDSRVRLFSQVNQGSSVARNTGLANAEGEYIAFLDADDLWDCTKLEKQVYVLEKNPEVGLVYTWVGSANPQGETQGKVRRHSVEGNVWKVLIQHNFVECGSNAMVRRICFETVGQFDPSLPYGQDWDMWLRIAACYPFKVIKEPLIFYRIHPKNKSRNWKLMEQSYNRIFEKVFALAPQHLQHLKSRSYGIAYLRIAWKSLQNSGGEYEQALYFQKQAIVYCPSLIYSREYARLTLASLLVRLFGLHRYNKMLKSFHGLTSSIPSITK